MMMSAKRTNDGAPWPTLMSALVVALVLAGCGGGDGSSTNPTDPNIATVAGVDADADGVRDDVETYIDQTYSDPATRSALRQFAAAAQLSMVDAGNAQLSKTHADNRFRAIECVMARRPTDYPEVFTKLRARILNTTARTGAYLQADEQVTAVAPRLSPADQWLSSCRTV